MGAFFAVTVVAFFLGRFSSGPHAAGLEQLAVSSQTDLEAALQELVQTREEINHEKLPLTRKSNELETRVLSRRRDLDRAQRAEANQLLDLNVLKEQVRVKENSHKLLLSLLGEYRRLFASRLHIAEADRYGAGLKEAQAARNNPDLSPTSKVELQAKVIDAALGRLEAALGGETFDGEVLAVSGKLEQGKTVLLGPVAVFASDQSEEAGVVQAKLNTVGPALVFVGKQRGTAIRAVVKSGGGPLPVDTTMGNAIKIAETSESVWEHIGKGGPVMIPILSLGLVAVIICLLKWGQVSRVQTAAPGELQSILEHLTKGARDLATKRARAIRGPVGEMLTMGIEHSGEQKEYVEEVMYEKMLDAKPKLERFVPIIAVTAAAAPLLGLLGTVTGMINTFKLIAIFGAGDPRSLSTGISEALITTEFGLIVAIPALLMHAFVSRKIKGFMSSMEQTSVAFINGVPESPNGPADGAVESDEPRAPAKPREKGANG